MVQRAAQVATSRGYSRFAGTLCGSLSCCGAQSSEYSFGSCWLPGRSLRLLVTHRPKLFLGMGIFWTRDWTVSLHCIAGDHFYLGIWEAESVFLDNHCLWPSAAAATEVAQCTAIPKPLAASATCDLYHNRRWRQDLCWNGSLYCIGLWDSWVESWLRCEPCDPDQVPISVPLISSQSPPLPVGDEVSAYKSWRNQTFSPGHQLLTFVLVWGTVGEWGKKNTNFPEIFFYCFNWKILLVFS